MGELGDGHCPVAGQIEGTLSLDVPPIGGVQARETEIEEPVWGTGWDVSVCWPGPGLEEWLNRQLEPETLVVSSDCREHPVSLPDLD